MGFVIEEKYEENETWIAQSLVKVNLMRWYTRLMTEFMHRKCFFRWLTLCYSQRIWIMQEYSNWWRKIIIAKGHN